MCARVFFSLALLPPVAALRLDPGPDEIWSLNASKECATKSSQELIDLSDVVTRYRKRDVIRSQEELVKLRQLDLALWSCGLKKRSALVEYQSGNATYHADNCSLQRKTPSDAQSCLWGKHLIWAGDSLDSGLYHSMLRVLGKPSERNKTKEQQIRGCTHIADCDMEDLAKSRPNLAAMTADMTSWPGGATTQLVTFVSCNTNELETIYAAKPDVLVLGMYLWVRSLSNEDKATCYQRLAQVVSKFRHVTKTLWRGPTCATKDEMLNSGDAKEADSRAKDVMRQAGALILDSYDLTCSKRRPDNFDWHSDGMHFYVGSAIPTTLAQLVLANVCPIWWWQPFLRQCSSGTTGAWID